MALYDVCASCGKWRKHAASSASMSSLIVPIPGILRRISGCQARLKVLGYRFKLGNRVRGSADLADVSPTMPSLAE